VNCRRCKKELELSPDGKTLRAVGARGHGVTCPTGGPHALDVPKTEWDNWDDTLDNWSKDVL